MDGQMDELTSTDTRTHGYTDEKGATREKAGRMTRHDLIDIPDTSPLQPPPKRT